MKMHQKIFDERSFQELFCPGNILYAPDGSCAVFTVSKADIPQNRSRFSLWKMNSRTYSYQVLVPELKDSVCGFIGNQTLLMADVSAPDKTVFYTLELSSLSQKDFLFSVPLGGASAVSFEDGFYFISAEDSFSDTPDPELLPDYFDSDMYNSFADPDCQVFDELPCRMDGIGFRCRSRSRLWRYDRQSQTLLPITAPHFQCSCQIWDSRNKILFYSGSDYRNIPSSADSVFAYSPAQNSIQKLCDAPGFVTAMAPASSGLYFAVNNLCGEDDFYYCPLNHPAGMKHCLALEGGFGWYLDTDAALSGGNGFCCWDDQLYFLYGDTSGTRLCTLNENGSSFLSPANMHLRSFAFSPSGELLCVCLPDITCFPSDDGLPEIYSLKDCSMVRRTALNVALRENFALSKPHKISWSNRRNDSMTGWFLPPADFSPEKKYPGFLLIHGGPRGRFEPIFNSDMQFLASLGFFVFFTNPHGSSGVSRDFARLENRMGTIDYEDFMDFTDTVCARIPNLDSSRLAVGGVSYGGYMTNWIIGHTDRFCSAISMSSISDWFSLYTATDLPSCVEYGCVGQKPWENSAEYLRSSPIRYASACKTPTLFLQGSADLRCPPDQAERMYECLISSGTPAKIILFPDESHHFAILGKPLHRAERYSQIRQWLQETILYKDSSPSDSDCKKDTMNPPAFLHTGLYLPDYLKSLQEILAIESIAEPDFPLPDAPYGRGPAFALNQVLELCRSFGFRVKNSQNRTAWAEIGEGETMLGILVHLDTVPLGEGWRYPQNEVTADRIYGRGAIDDKGPALLCIYAMKALLDSGMKLRKRIRMIFGQMEETGKWDDMEYYKATEELPSYGFTPDADFPVIYAEKGISLLSFSIPFPKDQLRILDGGLSVNAVPDKCRLQIKDRNGKLRDIFQKGTAAHGSIPHKGKNAISLAMEELYQLHQTREINFPFSVFYHEKIGMETNGASLGCAMNDSVSGALTVNAGLLRFQNGYLELTADIRYPVTGSHEQLLSAVSESARPYGISVQEIRHMAPVYVPENTRLLSALLGAYQDVTGDAACPLAIGGGTYARSMPNIVAFGALLPGRELTEHKPDENVALSDLCIAYEIYLKALYKMINEF